MHSKSMHGFKSALWALLTCVVALATVCALVLPEEDGDRDTFVRLTRTGLHRHCSPGASSHDLDDANVNVDTTLSPPGNRESSPNDAPAAVAPASPRMSPSFDDHGLVPSITPRAVSSGCHLTLSDRAPPAL